MICIAEPVKCLKSASFHVQHICQRLVSIEKRAGFKHGTMTTKSTKTHREWFLLLDAGSAATPAIQYAWPGSAESGNPPKSTQVGRWLLREIQTLSRQETPNSVLEGVYVSLNQILTHNLSNTCTRSIARSAGKTSMKDLNTTSLNKISRDISGPPGRKSIRDLSAGAFYLTGPIQDLLRSLDLLGPFTRALYKVSSQDHHVWHLYTRSPARSRPEIPTKDLYERSLLQELLTKSLRKTSIRQGPFEMFQLSTRSLPKTCRRDLFTRAVYKISSVSSQELSTRSLHKTSIRDLYTRALYKISSQDLYERSLQDLFARPLWEIQDLFTRPLWEIFIQELSTKCLHKPQRRRRYARSPDIPGPPRSLHSSSLQDLFTRPIYERSLYKSSLQDPFTRPLWEISIQELSTRSLHKTTMRDLVTRALYKISSQDPHMRHFYARSPEILGPPRSLHSSSLQDLFTRPIWRGL